jgi:L-malate glycosyltransferase
MCQVPVIWHVRDNLNSLFISRLLEFWTDQIVVISNAVRSHHIKNTNRNVKRIFNGISIKSSKQKSNDFFSTFINDTYILQISHLVPWKRHDLVISALGILRDEYPNLKLVIVGEDLFADQAIYIQKLKRLITKLKLEHNIIFTGYLNNVFNLIKNCEMLVHPSDNEPLGRVVVEAMFLGKLVVASNSGGICEYIKSENNGYLFEPDNVKDLVDKMEIVLNNKQKNKKITQNAVKTAHKYFDVSKQNEKVLSIYNKLLQY